MEFFYLIVCNNLFISFVKITYHSTMFIEYVICTPLYFRQLQKFSLCSTEDCIKVVSMNYVLHSKIPKYCHFRTRDLIKFNDDISFNADCIYLAFKF